jgi:serine/threonine-protein kinase SRPK3
MRRGLRVCNGLQGSQPRVRSLISYRVPTTWNIPARLLEGYVPVSSICSRRFVSSKLRKTEYVDEETLSDYNSARYCPIEPGSTIGQSYTALVKLGYGRTSTTWLCKDPKYVSSETSNETSTLTSNRGTYKVLKVGAADATNREKRAFEKIVLAAAHSEHPGSICVRQPERVFEIGLKGHTYNFFVLEPLGSNLLEYTNRPSNRPFGSQNVRFTAIYLLHAMDFLHTNGIAHTGKLSVTSFRS